jgi:hypothetical protein
MRSDGAVIASIGSQDAAQMRLAQDDEMVDALAPDRPDQDALTLGDPLPSSMRMEFSAHTGQAGWRRSADCPVLCPFFPANREFCKIVASGAPETPNSGVGTGR